MNAIADNRKSRGRPKTGIGSPVGLRLYADQEAAVDTWIEGLPDPKPSRPEALRQLVARGLSDTSPTASGVTSDDLMKVAKLLFEDARRHDPSAPEWDDYVASLQNKRNTSWVDNFKALSRLDASYETDDDLSEDFGDDAPLVRKVADLMRVVFLPPKAP